MIGHQYTPEFCYLNFCIWSFVTLISASGNEFPWLMDRTFYIFANCANEQICYVVSWKTVLTGQQGEDIIW